MWQDEIIQRNLRLQNPPVSQCTFCTSSIPRVNVKSIMHDTKVNFLKNSTQCHIFIFGKTDIIYCVLCVSSFQSYLCLNTESNISLFLPGLEAKQSSGDKISD